MCLSYLVWGKVVLSVCLLCYEDASYNFIDQTDHSKMTFQIYTGCDVDFFVSHQYPEDATELITGLYRESYSKYTGAPVEKYNTSEAQAATKNTRGRRCRFGKSS